MDKKKKKLRPVVKTHGGKYYLADFIVESFPVGHERMTYCEPFCGGASVFLNKPPAAREVLNDIDPNTVAILKALRDEPKEFVARLRKLKYTEKTFQKSLEKVGTETDYFERGVHEYVVRRMSRGGMRKAFAWSERLRGGQPGDVNAWKTMLKQLPDTAARLQGASIFNKSFLDVVKVWDEEDTLFYLDPPYLHVTRADNAREVYEHEMSVDDHMSLLAFCLNCRGKVMLSGYPSPLYDRTLKDWRVKKKNIANNSGQGKTKERRLEVLWMNY